MLPREKLIKFGPSNLTDKELLSILLGTGIKDTPVAKLAEKVLNIIDKNTLSLRSSDLKKIKGLGNAKICTILSAIEFSRRRIHPEGIKISSPTDVLKIISHYASKKQEYFLVITLNGGNEVIKSRIITIGLLNRTQIHPREVFAPAINDRSCNIIIAHNHPSGALKPSIADINITRRLRESGKILGITVLDHIIFSQKGFFSFTENNI